MIKAWSYIEEYKDLRKKILKSIDVTLKSGQIFFGKELRKFEKRFIKENNLKYGVAVGSGTDALYIALLGLGIKEGDEVITVSNTAIPTVSAIKKCGAKTIFVDIGSDYLINPNNIEKCISKNTKAIIPVHLYGQSCDMEKICKIAKKYNLKINTLDPLEMLGVFPFIQLKYWELMEMVDLFLQIHLIYIKKLNG